MFLSLANEIQFGSFKILDHLDKKWVLTKNSDYELISNICPHQKSLISTKDGSGHRICPYHNWSFDSQGNPLGSGRTEKYCRNNTPLDKQSVYNWNGMLFNVPVNHQINLDLSHFKLESKRIDLVQSSYISIMDLFLDVDHIEAIHKGVYNKIGFDNVKNIQWHYGDHSSLQVVPVLNLETDFRKEVSKIEGNIKYGALWLAVYPYTMIEWQPGSLFITISSPQGDRQTNVSVLKYKDTRYSDHNWKINDEVWETAWSQDRAQAELIVDYNSNFLEESKLHFRSRGFPGLSK